MPWAIVDTSIYLGHWERGLHAALLAEVRRGFIVRQSAVVLSELRRGTRSRSARNLVETLHLVSTVVWAPIAEDWWEAGRLVQQIGDAQDWETSKRREFQNDALIALTARRFGATVVTANRIDFGLLAREIGIRILSRH
jgi:predicted nucleic acid-binding protein